MAYRRADIGNISADRTQIRGVRQSPAISPAFRPAPFSRLSAIRLCGIVHRRSSALIGRDQRLVANHAAAFDRGAQPCPFQRQQQLRQGTSRGASRLALRRPASSVAVCSRSSTVAITPCWQPRRRRSASTSPSDLQQFDRSAVGHCCAGFRSFGSVETSRARPRCGDNVGLTERSNPFSSGRRARSSVVGAWVAISPTASSLRTPAAEGFVLACCGYPAHLDAPATITSAPPISSGFAPPRLQHPFPGGALGMKS